MYGEYDTGRYHSSSQDEDSGNFANSYPSFRTGKPKRTSRLGRGGSRLRLTDFKVPPVTEADDAQELNNEDSNSLTGPESASVMSWLRETPVKNSWSPPFVFRSVNTIDRCSGLHGEKSSINDYIDGIIPSGIPEIKHDKSSNNPLVAPECKRNLGFKSTEVKSNILQDVANIDFIRKTPGSKVGVSKHLEKEQKVESVTTEKENCVTNLFDTPKFDSFFYSNFNEPRVFQNFYPKTLNETVENPINSNKKCSPDNIVEPFYKKHNDFRGDQLLPDYVSNEGQRSSVESNSLNLFSKNASEPLDLKIKEHLHNLKDIPPPSVSNGLSSCTDAKPNIISNAYSDSSKNFCRVENYKPKEFNPFVPVSYNSENFQNFSAAATSNPVNDRAQVRDLERITHPLVQNETHQPKSYGETINHNKLNNNEEHFVHHSDSITPLSASISDSKDNRSNPLNTVLVIPKIEINSVNTEDKKSNENKSEKMNPVADNVSLDKITGRVVHQSENNKRNDVQAPSLVRNEQSKLPNSYASVVTMKPPANTQANSQQKTLMAPPVSTNLIRPLQGPVKTSKSTLWKPQMNTQAGKNTVLSRVKSNQETQSSAYSGYNSSHASKEASSREKIFVNNRPYDVLSILGKGGSSEVFLVLEPRSCKLMAVKCVNLAQVDDVIADGYLNEVQLLLKLQGCDSVIRMFDHEYVEDKKCLYVVMEKGDTDLSKLLREIAKTKNISMSMIIYYWTEMLFAVKDIHDKGIIHSDLKPANFLLVCGRLKLIDFGIASSLQGDMTSVHKEVTTGTWNYMSPEAIKNNGNSANGYKISYKSDVWSLGCILYNLIYGKTPFSHITNTWAKLNAIADVSHTIRFPDEMEGKGKVPPIILKTLKNCLTRDPKQRPSVAELLNYEYYQSSNVSQSKHDCTVSKIMDDIAEQTKNILSQESWCKVVQVLSQDHAQVIVGLAKTQIKKVLPLEDWNKIAHVFGEIQTKSEVPVIDST